MIFRPEDNEDLIGRWWRKDGYEYQLIGILYDTEDWWWLMARGGQLNRHTIRLSCVGNIETFDFEPIE